MDKSIADKENSNLTNIHGYAHNFMEGHDQAGDPRLHQGFRVGTSNKSVFSNQEFVKPHLMT